MTSWKPPTSHFGLQKASASHPQTLGPVWAGARRSSQLHPPAAIRKDPVPPGGNQSKSPTAQAGEGRVALPLVGVLGTEPDALPGLCGPSTWLGVAQAAQPSPVFLESTIPAEPCTTGSHGPLWSITTPLTLTAWLWLPEDAQVPTMPTGFSEAVGLSWGHTMMLYSGSVLFSLPGGRGSGLNPPADPPPWAALRSSPSSTFPDSALCPGPLTGPVAGRQRAFPSWLLVPIPTSKAARGNSPPCTLPVYVHPAQPSQPNQARRVPTQCPRCTPLRPARGGSPHRPPRANGSRGRRTLPKVPGEALVLPHLEPRMVAARQVPTSGGGRAAPAERGRRDSTRLCRTSARGPSRASRAGPAPAPTRVAPPRPAPPLRGDPSSSSRGAGAAPAVTAPSLGPLH